MLRISLDGEEVNHKQHYWEACADAPLFSTVNDVEEHFIRGNCVFIYYAIELGPVYAFAYIGNELGPT